MGIARPLFASTKDNDMTYPLSALACGVIGVLLVWIGIKARRSDVGTEGKVIMPVAGGLFLLGALVYAVLSVVSLLF